MCGKCRLPYRATHSNSFFTEREIVPPVLTGGLSHQKNETKMTYFNTTNERLSVLKQHSAQAQSQEDIIKEIFRQKRRGLTAAEVLHHYPDKRVPLTSIRRAITTLCNTGYLLKTEHKRDGIFGRTNFIYVLNTGQMVLFN